MAFCTNCGAKLADDAKFCTECGAKVEPLPSEPVTEPVTTPASASDAAPANDYTRPVSDYTYTPPSNGSIPRPGKTPPLPAHTRRKYHAIPIPMTPPRPPPAARSRRARRTIFPAAASCRRERCPSCRFCSSPLVLRRLCSC